MSSNATAWVPNNNASSAFVGDPPNTQRDWYIVRGLLRVAGMSDVDPAEGYLPAAAVKTDGPYSTKRPGVIVGLVVVLATILGVTGARLSLRASVSQMRFGVDDWATIAAAGMALTYTACQLIMAILGGGDHIWEHTYDQYNTFNYYGEIDKLIFYVTVALIKTSLTLFIRRLADRTSAKWRWFCDFFLFTLVVYIIGAIFWYCFTCNPPQSQWDLVYSGKMATPAVCLDTTMQSQVLNITHVVQGVILLSSPLIILWKVRMDVKKKLRLFFIWAVGLLAVLFGLMRMLKADFTSDITWTYTELLVWTTLDVAVGTVVISLPVLDAWLADGARKAMTKMGRTTKGGGLGNSGYGNLERSGYATSKSLRTIGRQNTITQNGSRHYPDSSDGIIDNKEEQVELGIIRTDEYSVRFTSAETTSTKQGVVISSADTRGL